VAQAPSGSGLKRLLVATDFSPRAEIALRRVIQIVSEQGAALTLFHVCDTETCDDMTGRQIMADAEESLRQKIDKLSVPDRAGGTVRVTTGKPFVEIIRGARDEGAEIVVLGAHGEHFLKDLLLGTTAEKVVRKGDCPVLVVKRAAHGPYRRVLAAVDFSEDSRQALALALRLAPRAKFYIVHAFQGPERQLWRADVTKARIARHRRQLAKERRQEMEEFLGRMKGGDKPMRRLLGYGRASHVITAFARRLRADLVSVGTMGRTGLPYILLGSVAEHVIREASCDVLAVRSGPSRFQLP
jgi:nucleotide-binding universal stress UspA family protein